MNIILALLRYKALLPAGFQSRRCVCVMSLARFFDKIAPALFLGMGASLAAAFSMVVAN